MWSNQLERAYIFLLLIIIIQACSLIPPITEFEYRGRTYDLNNLEILQDGNVYTLYLDKYSTESCLITIALNKADEFDEIVLTTKETYNVKISYGTCFIQMPDGSEDEH